MCIRDRPKEWSRQEQIDYTTEYIQKTFVDEGMCADWSIHDKGCLLYTSTAGFFNELSGKAYQLGRQIDLVRGNAPELKCF